MTGSLYDSLRRSRFTRRFRTTVLRFEPTAQRAGQYLAPPPYRAVARARTAARRRDWDAACRAWEGLLHSEARTHPAWHYEYAQVLDHLWRIDDAGHQRHRALEHSSHNVFDFHRLAGRAAADEAWEFASAAFERAASFDTSSESLIRAADAALDAGDAMRAADLYRSAIEGADEPVPAPYAGLGNALRKAGRLDEAERALADARRLFPSSAAVLAAHAWVATERRNWEAASHRWPLAFATRRRRLPPRWLFRYGEALEQLGRHRDAAEAYDLALIRLQAIDEPWAHWALLEWEFRRALCRHRCGDEPHDDPAFSVQVVGCPAGATIPIDAVGRFALDVTHLGLRVHGRLVDPSVSDVEIRVNGAAIKQVDVDRESPTPQFAFTIRHSALATFPRTASISVTTERGPLFDEHGQEIGAVENPLGDESLFTRLDDSEVFTKKGALVSRELAEISPRQLLDAYSTVRAFFTDQLGLDLFLMYGTLLGCHRDGRFIPGDDDLDVGYLTSCTDPEQLKQETRDVVRALLDAGFDISTRHGGSLFKIWQGQIDIDVYPVWFHRGRAWGYDAIDATPGDYHPAVERDLLGTLVLVPHRPEALLSATYGPGWRIPQPGFRHYRRNDVLNVLKRSSLTPFEARDLLDSNATARELDPAIGRFAMHNGGIR